MTGAWSEALGRLRSATSMWTDWMRFLRDEWTRWWSIRSPRLCWRAPTRWLYQGVGARLTGAFAQGIHESCFQQGTEAFAFRGTAHQFLAPYSWIVYILVVRRDVEVTADDHSLVVRRDEHRLETVQPTQLLPELLCADLFTVWHVDVDDPDPVDRRSDRTSVRIPVPHRMDVDVDLGARDTITTPL